MYFSFQLICNIPKPFNLGGVDIDDGIDNDNNDYDYDSDTDDNDDDAAADICICCSICPSQYLTLYCTWQYDTRQLLVHLKKEANWLYIWRRRQNEEKVN